MVTFLLLTTFFAYEGLHAGGLFYLIAVLAGMMAIYMIRKHLLNLVWFIADVALSFRYNLVYQNQEKVPHDGAVLLMSNHISWLDWLITPLAVERRTVFMMERSIYNWPIAHSFFKWGGAIPVSPKAAKDAFKMIKEHVQKHDLVTLFPEGGINRGTELQKFQRGYEVAVKGSEGVIVPAYLGGMEGSRLSRSTRNFVPKRSLWRRKVTIIYGDPVPISTTAEELQKIVQKLKEEYDAQ